MHEIGPQTGATQLRPGWALWLMWLLANVFGYLVGASAGAIVGIAILDAIPVAEGEPGSVPALILAGAAWAVVAGLLIGLAQWLALRPYAPDLPLRGWLFTTAGGLLAAVTAIVLFLLGFNFLEAFVLWPCYVALIAGAAGAVVGWAQWRALSRKVEADKWWIVVNAGIWAVGWILGLIVTDLVRPAGAYALADFLIVGAVIFALVGAVGGRTLVGLLREQYVNEQEKPAAPGEWS